MHFRSRKGKDAVVTWLVAQKGKGVCDDCVATRSGVGPRRAAWRTTHRYAKQGVFERFKGTCAHCGNHRILTKVKNPAKPIPLAGTPK